MPAGAGGPIFAGQGIETHELGELEERDQVALLLVTHSERLAARMQRAIQLVDGVLVEETVQRGAR